MKRKPSVNIVTLGCSKNIVDSEFLLKQLEVSGFDIHYDSNDFSDIVIVNTCGFIRDAKEESIDTILNFAEARSAGKIKKLIVMGCLSQRYLSELKVQIPETDAWFGVDSIKEIIEEVKAEYNKDFVHIRSLTTPSHYAYFKIGEGCNRKCSFCAIPLIRGKYISKSIDTLKKEAEALADAGVKELILIAQDLTYYGYDIYKKRKLASLLETLSDVKGIEWIRLQYAYPATFPNDVLNVMAERKNICHYLDIPFQHISDPLLKSMNRGHTKLSTYKLIEKIRKKIPDIALRTSLIVGYPGETKREFDELLRFVEDVRFDRLGVFEYSHEENTDAFLLSDTIKPATKRKRAEKLMAVQEEISFARNQQFIGKTVKVLFDKVEGDYFVGRTQYDSPEVDNEVLVKAPAKSKLIGQFKNVKITSAETFDLFGELCD
jgi:ribosomal protein S12 methylthiotransferase